MAVKRNEKTDRTSFAGVAKRISGWTANLLATAFIAIAALTFGRQVIQWWAADADHLEGSAANSSYGPGLADDPRQAHFLQFGDIPLALRRESVRGDKEAALAALRRACREAAERSGVISDSAGPAERRLLSRIESMAPVEAAAGAWEIYQIDGPFPLVAAVRQGRPTHTTSSPGQSVAADRRVVCWGVGLQAAPQAPGSEATWTLFTCAADGDSASSLPDFPPLPVPPGGRRTLSLRSEQGDALIGFRGHGRRDAWMAHFTEWFQRTDWRTLNAWRLSGGVWRASFGHAEGARVDVQLSEEADDGLSVLATVAPPRARTLEE